MSKTLYLECYSGISGDMTVGALLDLGADKEALKRQLQSLPVEGYRVEISRVKKSGLSACDFNVVLDEAHENHDHDNEYLYGHHSHGHEGHSHMHEHSRGHEGHSHAHAHAHEHRGLTEILYIIEHSHITERAKETASKIFRVLAEAEAKAHGTTIEEVHFHEVGAVDSIVDIVAAAICLDDLKITEVIVPELYEGRGTIRCQHGVIPVPVPATANIVQMYGLTLRMADVEAELVTPTGAAIVAAIRTRDKLPSGYRIVRTGLGAGKRDYGRTSVLRAMLIEGEAKEEDRIWKLETNIDDSMGETFGYVMERLFAAGAKDVYFTPIYMKKNRPAYELNVICGEEKIRELEEILFRETTTIGVRRVEMARTALKRDIRTVSTSLGEAQVKVCGSDEGKRVYPEYESVAEICRRTGRPYQETWRQVCREAQEELGYGQL